MRATKIWQRWNGEEEGRHQRHLPRKPNNQQRWALQKQTNKIGNAGSAPGGHQGGATPTPSTAETAATRQRAAETADRKRFRPLRHQPGLIRG